MSDPALGGSAIDLDALRRSLDRVVRQALDRDEFRQAVRGAVKQFLADVRRDAREASVVSEVERAVAWPVRWAGAEAIGFYELAIARHSRAAARRRADETLDRRRHRGGGT